MVTYQLVPIRQLSGPRGPQGPKGDVGTISGLEVTMIGPTEKPRVESYGPETNRRYRLYLPRGLSGTGAIPSDQFIAEVLQALDTKSRAAFNDVLATQTRRIESPRGRFRALLSARNERPIVVAGVGSSSIAGGDLLALLNESMQRAYPRGSTRVFRVQSIESTVFPYTGIYTVNAGRSGSASYNYLPSSLVSQVASIADVVIHMVGSNDVLFGTTPSAYKANIASAIAQLDNASEKPLMHVMFHVYPRMDVAGDISKTWDEYAVGLRSIAADKPNVFVVDTSHEWLSAGVPGDDPFGLVASDNVHPTDAGYRFHRDSLLEALGVPNVGETVREAPHVSVDEVFTSDSFTGPLSSTNANYGGVSKTWETGPNGAGFQKVGTDVTPVGAGGAMGVLMPTETSVRAGIQCVELPTGPNKVMFDVCRVNLGTSGNRSMYRVEFNSTGLTFRKVMGDGSSTDLFTTEDRNGILAGIVEIQKHRAFLTLRINGRDVFTTEDANSYYGGYAALSHAAAGSGRFRRFIASTLA